jgi:RHS repeat-associated protein
MLTAPGSTSYKYDGLSNRISQDTLKYLLDVQPGLTVVLGDSDGNHFVHTVRGIHAQEDNLGNWEYMAQDGLGSVRGLVDDAAMVQSSMSYDPYGVPDTSIEGFAYTGEMRDSNGLQYHRNRYYDASKGVWPSLDRLEQTNRYAYVRGNPINRKDGTGLFD